MKKYIILGMVLLLISIPCVIAQTGGLRISPAWSVMVESPYTFTIWCQTGSSYDVEILLIITEDCYDGMGSGTATDVVIVKEGTTTLAVFDQADFFTATGMGGNYVPPTGATTGARYTVASLKDHLDYDLSPPLESGDTIYWAKKLLGYDPLTGVAKEITITLNSDAPRMLIYLMGNSVDNTGPLDMRVPPTIPGFMIPEVAIGSIMAVASMFTALGLFAYKKKHTPTK